MASARSRIERKHFRLDAAKIKRAQRLLKAGTQAASCASKTHRGPRAVIEQSAAGGLLFALPQRPPRTRVQGQR